MSIPTDWSGKVLFVYVRTASPSLATGIAMKNVRLETVNDDVFLSGEVPHDPSDWTSGLQLAIRWHDIIHFIMIDDEESYLSLMTRARRFIEAADRDEVS